MIDFFDTIQYGDAILASIILIAIIIAAKIFYFFLKRVVHKLTAKTKTTLDDELVEALEKPVYIGIIIFGVFFTILSLKYFLPYKPAINEAYVIISILWGMLVASKVSNVILKWLGRNVAARTKKDFESSIMPILRKATKLAILVGGLLLIMGSLGIEITALVASLGIAGLAIALALQDTLSNFFAGTYMMTDKSLRMGDYVELDNGMKGFVEHIGWRSSRIKTLPGNIIIIPNSKLASSTITNYNYPINEMSVVIPVGVSYDSDLEKVEKVTIDVAKQVLKKTKGAKKDFAPFIRFNEFADSNINFSVILRVDNFVSQYLVKHNFIKELKKRYDMEKIEISYPVRVNISRRK